MKKTHKNITKIFSNIPDLKILKSPLLRSHTTLRVGGRAAFVVSPITEDSLLLLMKALKKHKLKFMILGNGSKTLFPDKGFNGVVIKFSGAMSQVLIDPPFVKVGAGVLLPDLVRKLSKKRLSGLEFTCGVPASVGGAVAGNFGALGHEISEFVRSVRVLTKDLTFKTFSKNQMKFAYRKSIVSSSGDIIVSAEFKLKRSKLSTIKSKILKALEWRKQKQPMGSPNAGSIFKNPKGLSAGKLIELCGFKGRRVGDAQVSMKHANFIVNLGDARAKDIKDLIKQIQNKVHSKFRIRLEPELKVAKG